MVSRTQMMTRTAGLLNVVRKRERIARACWNRDARFCTRRSSGATSVALVIGSTAISTPTPLSPPSPPLPPRADRPPFSSRRDEDVFCSVAASSSSIAAWSAASITFRKASWSVGSERPYESIERKAPPCRWRRRAEQSCGRRVVAGRSAPPHLAPSPHKRHSRAR